MTGAVLAGGESRRMGAPKEGIVLPDGRPMLLHILDALRAACDGLAVVGVCRGVAVPDGVAHVPDLRPGEGPMAGLEALLTSGLDDAYIVAGCDQPLLTPELVARLAAAGGDAPAFFRSEDGAEHHPFPGYYPATLAPCVAAALDRGERSPRRLLGKMPVEWITISQAEAAALRSFNTPPEFAGAFHRPPHAEAAPYDGRDTPVRHERNQDHGCQRDV